MVLPVGTVPEMRTKSAWSVDPWHCRAKLFSGGTDSDCGCDGKSIYHCNRDGYGDRHRIANCNTNGNRNKRSICDCNLDGDCDPNSRSIGDCNRNCNCDGDRDRRPGDGDGDTRGRIDGAGIYDADSKRGQSVRAEYWQ